MSEHSLDDFFLKGTMDRIDRNSSSKIESESTELDNYKKIVDNYNIWTEYDFDILLLVNRIINYLSYKSPNKAA
jgi:hypothetical protein